ncbi:hypothetical protein Tco_0191159 [Tanacetum coccineum]
MAAPGAGNQVDRRVVDDLVAYSGQTSVNGYIKFFKAQQLAETRLFVNRMHEEAQTSRNMIAQLNALIAEMEAFEDQGEVFDTLMGLRDDRRVEETKSQGLNDLVTQGEEEIEIKEAQLKMLGVCQNYGLCMCNVFMLDVVLWLKYVVAYFDLGMGCNMIPSMKFVFGDVGNRVSIEIDMDVPCLKVARQLLLFFSFPFDVHLNVHCWKCCSLFTGLNSLFFILFTGGIELSAEVVVLLFRYLQLLKDKMKVVFSQACSADESFIKLMRSLCSSLRLSLKKHHRLIAEMEALGQRGDALRRSLDYMRDF